MTTYTQTNAVQADMPEEFSMTENAALDNNGPQHNDHSNDHNNHGQTMSAQDNDAPLNDAQDNNGFAAFNLPSDLFKALVRMNYNKPTPVQTQAIPLALQGRDVLGSAQTGTGKTGAFCIPVIAKLLQNPQSAALILSPTRELAAQILDVAHLMLQEHGVAVLPQNGMRGHQSRHRGKGRNRKGQDNAAHSLHNVAEATATPAKGMATALLVGGAPMERQLAQLQAGARLIVGTPGRINDHLRRNAKFLENVEVVVLDEADRMLDMGFSVQIDDILARVSPVRQTLMFSATFPSAIVRFSQQYLRNPERISIAPEQVSAKNITHEIVHTRDEMKYEVLTQQLDQRAGSIIVFVKTKHGADKIVSRLARDNHAVDVIHGGLRQRQRDKAVAAFRARKTRIMIATDVAARGLDVPHIEHVINYDLPQNAEDYVHRIGRTARAGAEGAAVSFVSPSDKGKWAMIDRLMNPDAPRNNGARSGGRPQRDERPGYGNRKPHRKGGNGFSADGGFKKRSFRDDADGYKPQRSSDNPHKKGGFDSFKKDRAGGDTYRKPAGPNAGYRDGAAPRGDGKPSFRKDGQQPQKSFGKAPARQDYKSAHPRDDFKGNDFKERDFKKNDFQGHGSSKPAYKHGDRPERAERPDRAERPERAGQKPAHKFGAKPAHKSSQGFGKGGPRDGFKDSFKGGSKDGYKSGPKDGFKDGSKDRFKDDGFKGPFKGKDGARPGAKPGSKPASKPGFKSHAKPQGAGGGFKAGFKGGAKPGARSTGVKPARPFSSNKGR